MKIAIDIDGCITAYPAFFSVLSKAMGMPAHVTILTNRDPATGEEIAAELKSLEIFYHALKITANKAKYILENDIQVVFEDTDEYVIGLPESVCVVKVREPGNFDFDTKRWIYGPKTGHNIEVPHVGTELLRMMRLAEQDAQSNGLTFCSHGWVYCKTAERWINMSGTLMLELDHRTGIVSMWGRSRTSHDYARVK